LTVVTVHVGTAPVARKMIVVPNILLLFYSAE